MILFLYKSSQNSSFAIFAIRFSVQFYPKKKFLSLYSNMAAPNMNGRLHLEDAHQNSPASLVGPFFQLTWSLTEVYAIALSQTRA